MTEEEVKAIEKEYKHFCDFCPRRFKTKRAMRIHRSICCYNYETTAEVYEVEDIIGVFGEKTARWFLVKWAGYEKPEWERGHLLERDGCQPVLLVGERPQPEQELLPGPGRGTPMRRMWEII